MSISCECGQRLTILIGKSALHLLFSWKASYSLVCQDLSLLDLVCLSVCEEHIMYMSDSGIAMDKAGEENMCKSQRAVHRKSPKAPAASDVNLAFLH